MYMDYRGLSMDSGACTCRCMHVHERVTCTLLDPCMGSTAQVGYTGDVVFAKVSRKRARFLAGFRATVRVSTLLVKCVCHPYAGVMLSSDTPP